MRTYGEYLLLYSLTESDQYELTFVVFSDNFSPARATFLLQIGEALDDIEFVKS